MLGGEQPDNRANIKVTPELKGSFVPSAKTTAQKKKKTLTVAFSLTHMIGLTRPV